MYVVWKILTNLTVVRNFSLLEKTTGFKKRDTELLGSKSGV